MVFTKKKGFSMAICSGIFVTHLSLLDSRWILMVSRSEGVFKEGPQKDPGKKTQTVCGLFFFLFQAAGSEI